MRPETITIEERAARLARAVLLFLRGGPWTREDHENWVALTGSPLATTKTLGDMARRMIEETERAKAPTDQCPE